MRNLRCSGASSIMYAQVDSPGETFASCGSGCVGTASVSPFPGSVDQELPGNGLQTGGADPILEQNAIRAFAMEEGIRS